MNLKADLENVANIIREAAEFELLPRFGKLRKSDIMSKGGRDVVTTADFEAERRIKDGLLSQFPDTNFIGEEESDKNPDQLLALGGDRPVWVVDPLDGTRNFSRGKACFAIIIALIENGETQAGWIFDPVSNVMAVATRGGGAWVGGRRLELSSSVSIDKMNGSLGPKLAERLKQHGAEKGANGPAQTLRYGCVGREYIDLGLGKLHFALYGGKLKPWDHAAGVLIHHEAGGFSAMSPERTPYRPAVLPKNPHLLLAPDERQWDELHRLLLES